jgi:hypothetical protein
MEVPLPLCAAFQRRVQCGRRFDLRRREHVGRWHVVDAAATLSQLNINARRFGRGGSELHQPIRRDHLAVLQLQTL